MPQLIDNPCDQNCSLPEAIEALAQFDFDPRDEATTREAADWLRKLANNREFLGRVLLDRLAGRTETMVESGYGPQAIVLSPLRGNMFLRANIWPAEHDLCFRNSGAKTFVYGVPHDHNFAFLTCGYLGPGYESDYFEYDYEGVTGYSGELADLRFVERSALHEGRLMLYRAHRDVHSQLPPKALSISLNIMHVDPAQAWFDQYGFELESKRVTRVLSPNANEVFLRAAVAGGSDEAEEFAHWVGNSHPSERLRLASFEARAGRQTDQTAREDIWREGELSGSRMVAAVARERRAALAKL
ncbi:transposase [uncultured Erythrobacter sp.]|uniref:transposase n=1 Tax=uncultured Erythrobacter sp. TaxID=263913 RepID=UPI00261328F0|nr:transposase [uncultured Erythrobacter sp.]